MSSVKVEPYISEVIDIMLAQNNCGYHVRLKMIPIHTKLLKNLASYNIQKLNTDALMVANY